MPLLSLRSLTVPTVGAVAALMLLPACGAPPSAERVSPILLTEDDGTTRGPGAGARPVELPDPAAAGDDDVPARREPGPVPEQDTGEAPERALDPPADDPDDDSDDRDDRGDDIDEGGDDDD